MLATLSKPILKALLLAAIAIALMLTLSSFIGAAEAQNTGPACEGVVLAGGECSSTGASTSIGNVVSTIIDILSIIVGAVSVIMIIIGGLRYVVSSGDAQKVTSARQTILYAVVGLVIVIFAQVIVAFVITEVDTPPADDDAGLVLPYSPYA